MKLWMSAEISGDCYEPYSEIRKTIENTFNQSLSENDYGQSVESWDYIVILLPPDSAKYYEEIKKYHKSDKSLEFRLKIDNEQFKNSNKATQMKLVCESLLRSLDMPIVKTLLFFNYEQLREDFTKLCEDQNWL
jgi:hypothetical protein